MNSTIWRIALVITTILASFHPPICNPDDLPTVSVSLQSRTKSVLNAKSSRQWQTATFALISSSTNEELDMLLHDENTGIAPTAAWERLYRSLPKTEPDSRRVPSKPDIQRFIGFVEGKLPFKVPDWWFQSIETCEIFAQDRFVFSTRSRIEIPFRRFPNNDWIAPRDAMVFENEKGLKVTYNNHSFDVPIDIINKYSNSSRRIAVKLDEHYCFIAFFPTVLRTDYTLLCLERNHPMDEWNAPVWVGGKANRGSTGSPTHWVSIFSQNNTIFVIGLQSTAIYVNAFDRSTGEVRFRFSSDFRV